MIEHWQGQYVPTCDGCGRTLPVAEDFREAVDRMRAAEWLLIPPDPEEGVTDWYHLCPDCTAEVGHRWK